MYEHKYSAKRNVLRVFYISRIWRLFPVTVLFTVLGLLAIYLFNEDFFQKIKSFGSVEALLFWVPNFVLLGLNQVDYKILVPAWSLDIELQFYLLFPLLLYFFKANKLLLLIGAGVVTCLLSIWAPESIAAQSVCLYAFFFLTGVCICTNGITFSTRTEGICNLLFIGILVIHYLVPSLRARTVGGPNSLYNGYLNELLPLLLIPLLSNSVRNKSSLMDRTLGNLSFVLYLCHWVLLKPYLFYTEHLSPFKKMLGAAFYLVATVAVSYIIYSIYDKPIDSLRRRWVEAQSDK
jgi:peptidoglycan/LPS O-acetylase OafA/YrhL